MGIIKANPKANPDTITRDYLDSFVIKEKLLGTQVATTAATLLGQELELPIMTAALSGLDRFRENGTVEMAQGVKAAGSIMWMGVSEEEEVERAAATGVRLVEIIKPYADEGKIFRKIEHAKANGLIAVGMDIDYCFGPDGRFGTDRFGNPMEAKTVEQIQSYVKAAGEVRFIVKGTLCIRDTTESVLNAGAAAVVVSNHHGIYPFAVPPMVLLQDIYKEIGGKADIFVDGMIQDGYDAFKVIAYGASGVCVGRALQAALAQGGAEAVTQYLLEMNDQLRNAMSRSGSPNVHRISPHMIMRL